MFGGKIMNKSAEEVRLNPQVLHELDSPARRSFVKGIAGLGAALAASSVISEAEPAQSQTHAPESPSHAMSPVPDAWGPFTPSRNAGRYSQLTYPPLTKAGELPIGVTHTLWIPDGIQTVRAVIHALPSFGPGRGKDDPLGSSPAQIRTRRLRSDLELRFQLQSHSAALRIPNRNLHSRLVRPSRILACLKGPTSAVQIRAFWKALSTFSQPLECFAK